MQSIAQKQQSQGGQGQFYMGNYQQTKASQVFVDEEPKCCCCGCGYKGTAITMAILNGLAAKGGITVALFIFYCVMACKDPSADLAYTAAIINVVQCVLYYVGAGICFIFALYSFSSGTPEGIASAPIIMGFGIGFTIAGCITQCLSRKFYEFEEYLRNKEAKKNVDSYFL